MTTTKKKNENDKDVSMNRVATPKSPSLATTGSTRESHVPEKQWPVIAYCQEEVERQGHDVAELDGIERVSWMLNAWAYALKRAHETNEPRLADAIRLGQIVEPARNRKGIRTCGVCVGPRLCPPPECVTALLESLWAEQGNLEPIEFYKEFELIHPFVDGNGRTGKVLLNWLNGTLWAPIFPPADLFGSPIRNP